MWSHEHDARTRGLVDALAADIAGILSIDRLGGDTFPAFASAALDSLARALAAFASSINQQSPINRLPPELLSCIARLLPFPSVVSSAAVCRQWRSVLHNDTRLWTRLELHLNDTPAQWAAVLRPLLARARRFPLRLAIRFGCASHVPALQDCMKLVGSHLDHITELSIGSPVTVMHHCFSALIAAPAPMLEIFRIFCPDETRNTRVIKYVPASLFAGHAPRLHTLYGRGATMPPVGGPAFTRLKRVIYDHYPILSTPSIIANGIQNCLTVDTLVLVSGCTPDTTPSAVPPILSVSRLLIADNVITGTDALLPLFPAAARSTLLSYSEHSVPTARMLSHLQEVAPIRDIDLFVRPYGLARTSVYKGAWYAMRVNGALAHVDLNAALIRDLFSEQYATAFPIHTVERLALPLPLAELLPLFWTRLTGLRELVLYPDPQWATAWPSVLPSAATDLDTVRFVVRVDQAWPAAARASWTSQIGAIVTTLTVAIGRPMRRLVLPGPTEFTKADFADMVEQVVLDSPAPPLQDPGYEPWFWDFHEELAVHA